MDNKLVLGYQDYAGLKYHMEDALIEYNLNPKYATLTPRFALFSIKYYNEINELNHKKIYDYCFIGSIDTNYEARQWVINFAKKCFTKNSIFINTDNDPNWESLGSFDYSNKNIGFCPKKEPNNQSKKVQYRVVKENVDYFEKMCQSLFILCPAGDSPWSFRFYETLMCKSIPIVESWHHTYRTKEEATINYKYVLYQNIVNDITDSTSSSSRAEFMTTDRSPTNGSSSLQNIEDDIMNNYVNENIIIFEKYHLL